MPDPVTFRTRQPALLLIGPTGSGKTPLGEWLQRTGLWGRACHHFDFGAQLRAAARHGPSDAFTADEIRFLNEVLTAGALLENESFYLAERILDRCMARGIGPDDWLLLNGLPRHVAQAEALQHRLQVQAVVQLECDAPTVCERLRQDAGGDRAGRTDDDAALVARKLQTFAERTRPLVDYYRARGARILPIHVDVRTQPGEVAAQLAAATE